MKFIIGAIVGFAIGFAYGDPVKTDAFVRQALDASGITAYVDRATSGDSPVAP